MNSNLTIVLLQSFLQIEELKLWSFILVTYYKLKNALFLMNQFWKEFVNLWNVNNSQLFTEQSAQFLSFFWENFSQLNVNQNKSSPVHSWTLLDRLRDQWYLTLWFDKKRKCGFGSFSIIKNAWKYVHYS